MKYFRRGGLEVGGSTRGMLFDCCDVCFEGFVFFINEVGDGGRFDIIFINYNCIKVQLNALHFQDFIHFGNKK